MTCIKKKKKIFFELQDRFATQTIEHPFDERPKENVAPLNRSESTSRTPVTNFRDTVSGSQINYSPDHASSQSIDRLDTSPIIKKSDPMSRLETKPLREKEPTSPSVGLVIGTEPDPVLISDKRKKIIYIINCKFR